MSIETYMICWVAGFLFGSAFIGVWSGCSTVFKAMMSSFD